MDKEYIERNAAIEDIKRYAIAVYDIDLDSMCAMESEQRRDSLCGAIGRLSDMPAADVSSVRHGYWVFDGKRTFCSECSTNRPTDASSSAISKKDVHFCYFCGALMDGARRSNNHAEN